MISLFSVDVPLEFSCRLRPSAGAVDPNLVAYVIPGIPTRDHRTFIWQVYKKRMHKRHQKENLKSTLSSQKKEGEGKSLVICSVFDGGCTDLLVANHLCQRRKNNVSKENPTITTFYCSLGFRSSHRDRREKMRRRFHF